jgi:hypothetical protein
MKVIAINVKDKPNEIPTSRWLVKDREYTIIKIMIMKMQGGIAGVKLAEINNDDLFPWSYFRLDRFAITKEEIEKLIKSQEVELEYV